MNFDNEQTSHTIVASILSRTLDPKILTEEVKDAYIYKIMFLIGEKYFKGYHKLRHGSGCPEESVDVFKLQDA